MITLLFNSLTDDTNFQNILAVVNINNSKKSKWSQVQVLKLDTKENDGHHGYS